ncbi:MULTISPECIES: SDH family Clp fold serine proteinase [Marinomonas]|uniref:S49 family peptidase n=1 Tax=Marinomonas arctica TaxID=383750 RepID=A0A7H1J5I6_9GAMM|nr:MULTISPECIES: S49 family peptidase [Marinomonas]MCS7488109.1 hypothetical protein [Marinomonas sp. BSi20414]QNT05752.1 S49 family peptidase [Marinomonas arctica]GGN36565.1 serine protease [Marinomonas arctica]
MPCLNDILNEINALNVTQPNAVDVVRKAKIKKLNEYTERNVICYYSGWLSVEGKPVPNLSIDDMDKNGFMNTIEGLDCSLGLDLILHTPGGSITAAESLVYYLRAKFGKDIRVIVPQMAMSAGTMIACSAKEIIMGHQSCIGPFDPFVKGVSAFAVFEEFKRATEEIQTHPHTLPLWQVMIQKYPPAFLEECEKAIELATSIVPKWLSSSMLSDQEPADQDANIKSIMENLNNPGQTKEHSRHIHADKAISLGLNVVMMESDQNLQDLVLSLHHAYMATFLNTNTAKIIESHHDRSLILKYA